MADVMFCTCIVQNITSLWLSSACMLYVYSTTSILCGVQVGLSLPL